MSDQDKEIPAEHADESKTEDTSKAVGRFAQYTSPVMLAMLVSSGHDVAAATCSPCA